MQKSLVKAFGMDVRHEMAHWEVRILPVRPVAHCECCLLSLSERSFFIYLQLGSVTTICVESFIYWVGAKMCWPVWRAELEKGALFFSFCSFFFFFPNTAFLWMQRFRVCWDEPFSCIFGKQAFVPAFLRLSTLEVFAASGRTKCFLQYQNVFQLSVVVQKSVSVGGHFSGLPSPSYGKIICLLPGGVEEWKSPHFTGGFCCCRGLHCVLASALALGHDAGQVTSTMAGATYCICPHLCKAGLRPCGWIWGALSSWRCSLKSTELLFKHIIFIRFKYCGSSSLHLLFALLSAILLWL